MFRPRKYNPKMYCFKCDKMTEKESEREETWKEWIILREICKICNSSTMEKLRLIKKPKKSQTLI